MLPFIEETFEKKLEKQLNLFGKINVLHISGICRFYEEVMDDRITLSYEDRVFCNYIYRHVVNLNHISVLDILKYSNSLMNLGRFHYIW